MKPCLKELKVLFQDKGLDGVLVIKEDSWKNGVLLSCPIENIRDLAEQEEVRRLGIGILLSSSEVLVDHWFNLDGCGDPEFNYIKCPEVDYDGWDRIVILTTEDGSFSRKDFEYLITCLREKADECGTLSSRKQKKIEKPKIDKFKKAALDQYLEGALFILGFMGIDVFRKNNRGRFIPNIPMLLHKGETISYLEDRGVDFGARYISYAKRQTNKEEFWNNAKAEMIDSPWVLVLNDQVKRKLYVLEIPARAFETTDFPQKGKVLLRSDKPYYLDLHINTVSLVDGKSGIDFSKFVTRTFEY